jgi:peptide/nickel transport system substrate-binding protein
MDDKRAISRRAFLRAAALTAAGSVVVACQPQTVVVEKEVTKVVEVEKEVTKIVAGTPVVEKVVETQVVTEEKVVEVAKASARQAPQFRDMVSAGKLPPLEERLPVDPLVIKPLEEIGQYGGTLHAVAGWGDMYFGRSGNPFEFSPPVTEIVPQLFSAYEFSDDAKAITLYFRKGGKWSNGDPFTADDLMWSWEDLFLNKDVTPTLSGFFAPGGEPMQLEKVDDYTVTAHFAIPSPAIMTVWGHAHRLREGNSYNSQYLKQWHPKYNKDADALAKKEGYDNWVKALGYHRGVRVWNRDPNTPTNEVWIPTEITDTFWKDTRNPYLWQVDSEGNQLPYLDGITAEQGLDQEGMNIKIISGEASYAGFAATMDNYTLYKEHEKDGNYRVLGWRSHWGSAMYFAPNTLHKDLVLRQIFGDVRFRRALSLAIDRDEINDKIFFGLATPRQATLIPTVSFYKEEWGTAYAQYDPDQSNQILDEMGLDRKDADGYRLRPDGATLSVVVEWVPGEGPKGPVAELVRQYWEEIGIKVALKEQTRAIYEERLLANEHDIGSWHADTSTEFFCQVEPIQWYPTYMYAACIPYQIWFNTKVEQGEEPTDEWKDLVATFKQWNQTDRTKDPQEWTRLAQKIWDFHANGLYLIGTVGMPVQPMIFRNGLMNVPQEGWWSWDSTHWDAYPTSSWFVKE